MFSIVADSKYVYRFYMKHYLCAGKYQYGDSMILKAMLIEKWKSAFILLKCVFNN